MRSSDWSSDVCSSDRNRRIAGGGIGDHAGQGRLDSLVPSNEAGHVKSSSYIAHAPIRPNADFYVGHRFRIHGLIRPQPARKGRAIDGACPVSARSEEHTSELQSLMRISYAVFCLKKT